MKRSPELPTMDTSNPDIIPNTLVQLMEDVFEVHSIRRHASTATLSPLTPRRGATVEFLGRLRVPSDRAYRLLAERFRRMGYLALLRKSGDDDLVIALPGKLPSADTMVLVPLLLFLATVASVLYVGRSDIQGDVVDNLLYGWPFAASLIGILMAHEFGHYIVSRVLGVPASLPYLIPFPLPPFGTLGAVIRMKAPPHNRRELLAIAAAGPLAGLVVGLPLLIWGLSLSSVETIPSGPMYTQEGNSLLYIAFKFIVFGRFLPAGGFDVFLHPVAMAGWTGLLVTALNLIPAGQLDGGHIAYALLGERARWLPWGIVAVLLALSYLWIGWLLWAGIVYVFGKVHAVPFDDVTRLRTPERALAVLLLIIFVLVFTPIPLSLQ